MQHFSRAWPVFCFSLHLDVHVISDPLAHFSGDCRSLYSDHVFFALSADHDQATKLHRLGLHLAQFTVRLSDAVMVAQATKL